MGKSQSKDEVKEVEAGEQRRKKDFVSTYCKAMRSSFPSFCPLTQLEHATHMLMLFPPMKEVVGAIYKSLHETFSAKETCPSKCYARLMPTAQELLRGVYDI